MDAVISPEPVALTSDQILRRAPMTVSLITNNTHEFIIYNVKNCLLTTRSNKIISYVCLKPKMSQRTANEEIKY